MSLIIVGENKVHDSPLHMSMEVESEIACGKAIVRNDILGRLSDVSGPVQHAETIIQDSESTNK